MPGERRPAAEEEGADTRLDRKQNYHGAVTGYGIITWCSSWWGRGTLGERAGLSRGAGHLVNKCHIGEKANISNIISLPKGLGPRGKGGLMAGGGGRLGGRPLVAMAGAW